MKFNPAKAIQNLQQFGEFGGVNPSITDSSTYTFMEGETMEETFLGQMEGCFLYSRHWNPSNKYLADALAAMENTESAWITASGMAAITCSLLQLCSAGDHIVTWNAQGFPSGIYFYRLTASNFTETRKIVLLK